MLKIRFNKNESLNIYHKMILIRRFEEKLYRLYNTGFIRGFCHLCIGQEAIAVAISDTKKEEDTIITSYRDHGLMLSQGSSAKSIMAELLGKEEGCSKGRGGSMHMFNISKKFYGGHGIVGAQVPIGTGIALSHKYKKNNNISITLFGDGACHQGQVYESFNISKLWSLPVLYIIENNKYAMGTSIERSSSTVELYKRGESFGIEGRVTNDTNFFEMYNTLKECISFVRKEKSPLLLEIKTYRYKGHSMSDPDNYRTKEEVNEYKNNRDPIKNFRKIIIENKIAKDEEFNFIESNVKTTINDITDWAKKAKQPNIEQLYDNIYY